MSAELQKYVEDLHARGRHTPLVAQAAGNAAIIRQQNDTVFYLAGALTGVNDVIKERYAQTSRLIETRSKPGRKMFGYAPHLHGTDPVAHPVVSPNEVRDVDYMFAAIVPDYHINWLYPVAHGNAIEEGWAEAAGIPALYLRPAGMRLSRLVLGMCNIVDIIDYDDFATDGLTQIGQFLDTV